MEHKKYLTFKHKIIILGFGSIGQATLPLLLRHLDISPSQIVIISKTSDGVDIAKEWNITLQIATVTKDNYHAILNPHLQEGDFLLNLSTGIASKDLIDFCQDKNVIYLDASIEPWEGLYTDDSLAPALRTNYALREGVLPLKKKKTSTAVLTHGANPGLVSHFVKQALWNMANDNHLTIDAPKSPMDWAKLAQSLEIKAIHISERDTQVTNKVKTSDEFVNTWSVEGLMGEGAQPAELGWGTHERHWPDDAAHHTFGSNCSIYLNRTGISTKVRSWSPSHGTFHGFLITHAESISIADYLTVKNENQVDYRPTVHYAYFPCPDATVSLLEFAGNEWCPPNKNRLLLHEIIEGTDELGVLLMGNKKGAYWYGSQLSIHEARKQIPHNSATSLQVASGVFAALLWAIENPWEGVVEPEDIEYQYILDIASPYLGKVGGYYTNWTPLDNRERLFAEKIDPTDPWQFINIRVQ